MQTNAENLAACFTVWISLYSFTPKSNFSHNHFHYEQYTTSLTQAHNVFAETSGFFRPEKLFSLIAN